MALRPRLAMLALFVAALGAAAAWHAEREGPPDPASELARLVPGHRPLLGRGSLAMPHAPFDPAAPPVGPDEREGIYARLLAAKVAGVPGAEAALAAFYAKRGEAGDADRALAAAQAPVDRGVVLLALDRPDEALEEFARALAERPGDPAALFDSALALEALLLDGQAARGWEEFLAVESAGRWADEARTRLAGLRAERVSPDSPDRRKRKLLLALFEVKGRDDVAALRPAAEELAGAGDPLALRSVETLERLDAAGWNAHLDELRRFNAAREEVGSGRDAGAQLRPLEASPDPVIAVKATHFAAYGALLRGDLSEARAALLRLRRHCASIGCVEEPALVTSDLGNLRYASGDRAAARRAFAEARAALPPSFTFRQGELACKEAMAAFELGELEAASQLLTEAIRLERAGAVPELVHSLGLWAEVLSDLGRPAAALAAAREALAIGVGQGSYAEAQAGLQVASVLADAGRLEEAISTLRPIVERLGSTDLRPTRARCLEKLAWIDLRAGHLEAAETAARDAFEVGRPAGSGYEAIARVARARGDLERAIAALRDGVELDRALTAKATGPLSSRRVESALSGRRVLLAALLGEQGRAEAAYEAFVGGKGPPLRPDECRIGFALVDGHLLSFSASAAGPRFEERPLPPGGARLLETAAWSDGREAAARALGSPWGPQRCPDSARWLAIREPPGALRSPIAALARTYRPDAVLGVALSPGSVWPERFEPRRALAVVSPTVPGEELPSLPSGDRDARVIERHWPTLRIEGARATPDQLAVDAPGADLLHFSLHGVSRAGQGGASFLMLAGPEGRVSVPDVLALSLQARRPLVVLSACQAAGSIEHVEADGGGLPWAFLAAGAGAVVAPAGTVDDRAAGEFAEAFYAELAAGTPVPLAVTTAAKTGAGTDFALYF